MLTEEETSIEFHEPLTTPSSMISQYDPTIPYSQKKLNLKPTDADDMSTTSGVEYNMRRTGSSHEPQKQTKIDTTMPDESESFIDEDLPLSSIPVSLILHPSDTQVKPIINNRYIEPVEKYSFSKSASFPFTPVSLENLESFSQSKLESYVSTVRHHKVNVFIDY